MLLYEPLNTSHERLFPCRARSSLQTSPRQSQHASRVPRWSQGCNSGEQPLRNSVVISPKGFLHLRVGYQGLVSGRLFVSNTLDATNTLRKSQREYVGKRKAHGSHKWRLRFEEFMRSLVSKYDTCGAAEDSTSGGTSKSESLCCRTSCYFSMTAGHPVQRQNMYDTRSL